MGRDVSNKHVNSISAGCKFSHGPLKLNALLLVDLFAINAEPHRCVLFSGDGLLDARLPVLHFPGSNRIRGGQDSGRNVQV